MGEQLVAVPRVIFAQRVIDKMVQNAMLYGEETGEAMVGLVLPQPAPAEPDIYVLDTISPGENVVRERFMFEQGDDWQGDVFQWMYVNWDAFRDLRRTSYGKALAAKWDTPLVHVGDWHKHPGDMVETSGGDLETARSLIMDSEMPVDRLVAPIVTVWPLNPIEEEPEVELDIEKEEETSEAKVEDQVIETLDTKEEVKEEEKLPARALAFDLPDKGRRIRIDFWYLSKRHRDFVAIKPEIWANDRLPSLPPVAWHLQYPKRFDQEYNLLTEAGYAVDTVRWDADGKPPYEICFSIYKPGSDHVILLITPADYPARMPAIRTAPLVNVAEDEDVFEKLYDASKPVLMSQMPDWTWDNKRTLLELVWHTEKVVQKG
jgi:hypothetical protein